MTKNSCRYPRHHVHILTLMYLVSTSMSEIRTGPGNPEPLSDISTRVVALLKYMPTYRGAFREVGDPDTVSCHCPGIII